MTKPASLSCDCVVIGGGIAGVWLLARLRQAGYHALLVEANQLGSGQTLYSQGIIHGGVKYSLSGSLSGATRAISAMPERWRRCLSGQGELDLRAVRVLSEQQYLITSDSLGSRLSGFFASQALQSQIQPVTASDYPAALQNPAFQGRVYRLHEPVLQIDSVLAALLAQVPPDAVLQGTAHIPQPDTVLLQNGTRALHLHTRCVIWTAGAGNAAVDPSAQQSRPLHMVLARSPSVQNPLPLLYGHCVGVGDKPRLTITSHTDRQGRLIWYIGGLLAENGVALEPPEQIAQARSELALSFPWLDWSAVEFATCRIARAEGRQVGGKRPDLPVLQERKGVLLAWPTKLALAPLLADQVMDWLQAAAIQPGRVAAASVPDWPRPALADYPWEQDLQWN